MTTTKSSLRDMRSFLILWGSQAVSQLGSSMTSYALILWVYGKEGTATSISLLSFFTYAPAIVLGLVAGALADRWNKKLIMLASDAVAALGTVAVFALYATGNLRVWHLYAVNLVISVMGAFQGPASSVAVSLLAPRDQYTRVGGLYAFSGSIVAILSPAFATALMAFGGLGLVFSVDLCTFAVGFLTLLLFIRIPEIGRAADAAKESVLQSCAAGLRFIRRHRDVLEMMLFFCFINLIAYMTGLGIFPALILKRTGDSQTILGMASTARGVGALIGSILVTVLPPAKRKLRTAYLACAISFLTESVTLGVARAPLLLILAPFLGEFCLPFLNANLTSTMRERVPLELQGRVYSVQGVLQCGTVPVGLFLGGILADNVFEPMAARYPGWLSVLVGGAPGGGIGLMFLVTGIMGVAVSAWMVKRAN